MLLNEYGNVTPVSFFSPFTYIVYLPLGAVVVICSSEPFCCTFICSIPDVSLSCTSYLLTQYPGISCPLNLKLSGIVNPASAVVCVVSINITFDNVVASYIPSTSYSYLGIYVQYVTSSPFTVTTFAQICF